MPRRVNVSRADIVRALIQCLSSRHAAASLLGISVATLRRRVASDPGILQAVDEPGDLAAQKLVPELGKLNRFVREDFCEDNMSRYDFTRSIRMTDKEVSNFLARAKSPTIVE